MKYIKVFTEDLTEKEKICNHISLFCDKSQEGIGEYSVDLEIYCEICKKKFSFIIEIN